MIGNSGPAPTKFPRLRDSGRFRLATSFVSGERCFVTRQVRPEDRRLTPVPSGHVLSETAGVRDRPSWPVSNLISRPKVRFLPGRRSWAGIDGVTTRILDCRKAPPFLVSSILVYPTVRRGVPAPGDRHGVVSTGGSPRVDEAADSSPRAGILVNSVSA